MRSSSPYAPHPPEDRPSVLQEILVIDGVTDLAVYRMLTGRWEPPQDDVPRRPRPDPASAPTGEPGEQLGLFLPFPGEEGARR